MTPPSPAPEPPPAPAPSAPEPAAVVLITGASRGIGQATADAFARLGSRLCLCARPSSELDETLRLLPRPDHAHPHLPPPPAPPSEAPLPHAIAVPADVTDPAQVDALVHQAVQTFGRVDVLVHAAGLAPAIAIEDMDPDRWRQVIETNLSSAFYLAHALWPTFKRQQSGVIVLLSSFACRDPFPGFAAYGAAKAGLNTLALVLAREGAPIGVRAHVLALGAVETRMFRALRSAEQWPADQTLQPAEVARLIIQCAQGDLRYTSGEVIFLSKTR